MTHDSSPSNLPAEPDQTALARVTPGGLAPTSPPVGGALRPMGSTPDAFALLKALKRRWLQAAVLSLLCAGVAAAVTYVVVPPARYEADALLLIAKVAPKVIFQTADDEQDADYGTFQRTQVELIRSRTVLGEVLSKPDIAQLPTVAGHQEDGIEWLQKELEVGFLNGSEILRIALKGDRPADLKALVQAVTDVYMSQVVQKEQRQRMERLEKLKELWGRYQTNLKQLRQNMRVLAEQTGSNDRETLAKKQQLEMQALAVAEQELREAQRQIRLAQVEIETLESQARLAADAPIAAARIREQVEADPEVRRLSEEEASLAAQAANLLRVARSSSDPARAHVEKQRRTAKQALERVRAQKMMELVARQREELIGGREGSLLLAKQRLETLKRNEQVLRAEVDAMRSQVKTTGSTTLDLQSEQEEIAIATETTRKIGAEMEALEVELTAPPRIRPISAATEPKTKDDSKKLKMAGAMAAGTFGLVLIGIAFLEYSARKISSVEEVVNGLGMNVVGALPALPSRSRPRLGGPSQAAWQNTLIESVDATRTMLLHASRTEGLKVILVTSALNGEGKTSLSSHLASSLARAGRKTLLIDCDCRRPSLHRLFDVLETPGYCELVRGQADLMDVIHPTAASNLSVVPAGQCDATVLQLLAQDQARAIFDQLKSQFDFIIVDSAPVLPVVDTLLLSQQVDAVLFSLLQDVSRAPSVRAAYDRLSALGVRMLGAVVNGAADEKHARAYGYSYA